MNIETIKDMIFSALKERAKDNGDKPPKLAYIGHVIDIHFQVYDDDKAVKLLLKKYDLKFPDYLDYIKPNKQQS